MYSPLQRFLVLSSRHRRQQPSPFPLQLPHLFASHGNEQPDAFPLLHMLATPGTWRMVPGWCIAAARSMRQTVLSLRVHPFHGLSENRVPSVLEILAPCIDSGSLGIFSANSDTTWGRCNMKRARRGGRRVELLISDPSSQVAFVSGRERMFSENALAARPVPGPGNGQTGRMSKS